MARAADSSPADAVPASADDDAPRDLDGLIRQSRQPQFVSSAYFLRFRFDEGRYALVGPEQLDAAQQVRVRLRGLVIWIDTRSTPPSCSETRSSLATTVSGSPMTNAPSGPEVVSNCSRDGGRKPRSAATVVNISCQPG